MDYKYEDLEKDISDIMTSLAQIREDRGKRYGKVDDTLANIRISGGFRSAQCHAQECLCRIQNQCWKPIQDTNSKEIDNAASDLINYALYILILYRQEYFGEIAASVETDLEKLNDRSSYHIPMLGEQPSPLTAVEKAIVRR